MTSLLPGAGRQRGCVLLLSGPTALAFSLAQFGLILLLLLPPTPLVGAKLPVLSRLFATEASSLGAAAQRLGEINARLYGGKTS